MDKCPLVNIVVMQPPGYVHSLGLLDPARYLRYQLRRLGAEVLITKNRVREDALNIVLGAHLGFPPEWKDRHACIFFNLEQLGPGGANLPPAYLQLLQTSAAVDYDVANVSAYCATAGAVPVVPLLHAPYLESRAALPLEQRPIDLLFFGCINPRRRAFLDRIEACGWSVAVFDHPLYGAERDEFIVQAKAVVNCHHYDSARFEQVRAQHCLSLGTPFISERIAPTSPPQAFEDAVTWIRDDGLETFFQQDFATARFFDNARTQLAHWRKQDSADAYAILMACATDFMRAHASHKPRSPWQPKCINLGSGKDYKAGWLNLDLLERAEPDLVLDLSVPQTFPLRTRTRFGSALELSAGSVARIHANNVLEHVRDLPCLMTNALALLCDGGEFEIEVPYEGALTAWQDPTHVRAMNENSWLYYTDWFWYLGWFEHRFEIAASQWLDTQCRPCAKGDAAFMKMTLRKTETTLRERTAARASRADFMLPDDEASRPCSYAPSQAPAINSAQALSLDTRAGKSTRSLRPPADSAMTERDYTGAGVG